MTVGAILPAAGRGTRMARVTDGSPKELIPLGGRTVLDFVLDEAERVALHVCVVSAPGKPEVDAHAAGRAVVVHQELPRGFAHAVRLGIEGLPPCDAYLVLLPDTLFAPGAGSSPEGWGALPGPGPLPPSPLPQGEGAALPSPSEGNVSARLLELLEQAEIAIAAKPVPESMVSRYGILETDAMQIRRILEKPRPDETESRLAISARYAFRAGFAQYLQAACDEHDALGPEAPELSLSPVIGRFLEAGGTAVALSIEGWRRLDCGDPQGYAEAREVFGA